MSYYVLLCPDWLFCPLEARSFLKKKWRGSRSGREGKYGGAGARGVEGGKTVLRIYCKVKIFLKSVLPVTVLLIKGISFMVLSLIFVSFTVP